MNTENQVKIGVHLAWGDENISFWLAFTQVYTGVKIHQALHKMHTLYYKLQLDIF